MACFLSSNGHISVYFDNIHQNFQHMPILRCTFAPCSQKYQNMKILNIEFYDVITNELYSALNLKYDSSNCPKGNGAFIFDGRLHIITAAMVKLLVAYYSERCPTIQKK